MRLLFISVGTLFVFGMLLLMTRFWGLSQGYQAFAHPFLEPRADVWNVNAAVGGVIVHAAIAGLVPEHE